MPYDRFVREMLTASGSNFDVPQVNFYRAVQSREPTAIAQAVALSFMGVRPASWPKERWSQMAVFFSQIGYKTTEQWKEEIVLFDPGKAPASRRPTAATEAVFPDGTPSHLAADQDPARGICRLAHVAQESLVRAQHREPRLVVAVGPRHHSRAGRRPARTIRRSIPSCWPIWSENWSPAITT